MSGKSYIVLLLASRRLPGLPRQPRPRLGMGIRPIVVDSAVGQLDALGGVAIGALVCLVSGVILKVPEIKTLTSAVSNRIKRA